MTDKSLKSIDKPEQKIEAQKIFALEVEQEPSHGQEPVVEIITIKEEVKERIEFQKMTSSHLQQHDLKSLKDGENKGSNIDSDNQIMSSLTFTQKDYGS